MVRRLVAVALSGVWLATASPIFAADAAEGSDATPLLVAASNGDLALVNRLLKGGANPNVRSTFASGVFSGATTCRLPFMVFQPPTNEVGSG